MKVKEQANVILRMKYARWSEAEQLVRKTQYHKLVTNYSKTENAKILKVENERFRQGSCGIYCQLIFGVQRYKTGAAIFKTRVKFNSIPVCSFN